MGGQACILYGAAEFSRDIDWAIDPSPENLERLTSALRDVPAEPIFLPPLSPVVLLRGHACHFRSIDPEGHRLRIDVLSVMRGVDPFEALWARRRTFDLPVGSLSALDLPDLVRSKKTQRDKDWPMIRRLIEADVASRVASDPSPASLEFWFEECRTPSLLADLARLHPGAASEVAPGRAAVARAIEGDLDGAALLIEQEEREERRRDREYWAPLRAELERWRHERLKQ